MGFRDGNSVGAMTFFPLILINRLKICGVFRHCGLNAFLKKIMKISIKKINLTQYFCQNGYKLNSNYS